MPSASEPSVDPIVWMAMGSSLVLVAIVGKPGTCAGVYIFVMCVHTHLGVPELYNCAN